MKKLISLAFALTLLGATTPVLAYGGIALSTSSLSFNTTVGTNPAGQSFTLVNTSSSYLTWNVATNYLPNWVTVSPTGQQLITGGQSSSPITVHIAQPQNWPAGTYYAQVVINYSSNQSLNQMIMLPVTLTISGSANTIAPISASPSSLGFNATVGGGATPMQTVTVNPGTNNGSWGAQVQSSSIPGLNVYSQSTSGSRASGYGVSTFTVGVSGPFTYAGTYSGTIIVTNNYNQPVTVYVTLMVTAPTVNQSLSVYPNSLNFSASNPSSQGLALSGLSGQWIASVNPSGSWLRINGSQNGATGIIGSTLPTVSVDPNAQQNQSVGIHYGSITISSYDNPSRFAQVTIPVSLTVSPTTGTNPANNGSVTITSPSGGQIWSTGSVQQISWIASGARSVKIVAMDTNGNLYTIAGPGMPNTGYYYWVPNNFGKGSGAMFKIGVIASYPNGSSSAGYSTSYFTVR